MAARKRTHQQKNGGALKRAQVDEIRDPHEKKPVKAQKQPEAQVEPTGLHFAIAGIGASPEGLEALEELLENMPTDTGMAFVVVTHQHPG
jgi:chemotaxis response regulator CheB